MPLLGVNNGGVQKITVIRHIKGKLAHTQRDE